MTHPPGEPSDFDRDADELTAALAPETDPAAREAADLAFLAGRATRVPGLLGHALARYAALENLPGGVDDAVAGLRPAGGPAAARTDVERLMLCRAPSGPALFREAGRVADDFGLDRGALVALLRHVEVVDAMNSGGAAGLLAARRDDEEEGAP